MRWSLENSVSYELKHFNFVYFLKYCDNERRTDPKKNKWEERFPVVRKQILFRSNMHLAVYMYVRMGN